MFGTNAVGTCARCCATCRIWRDASQKRASKPKVSRVEKTKVNMEDAEIGSDMGAQCRSSATISVMTENITLLGKSDQNLVWLDCEMTGLEPDVDRLLEIAVIVTGPNLEPRIEGPVFVIHQSDEQLDKMDAWNKGTHGKSGLIDKVKASTVTEAEAEALTIAFLSQ